MAELISKITNYPRRRLLLASLLVMILCTFNLQAQNLIKGTVVDATGDPLPGVSISVKSQNTGTVTNLDGKYQISASPKAVLEFTYIGMATQVIRVDNRSIINITMNEDVSNLDEVVVIGYGTQKRGSITGAISTVSSKELLKAPTMSISNIVGARVAGISAVQASGQPGSDNASLKIRGQEGLIYVIDCIRRTASDFNGLDPNEIESVSVLKDATAVAVYGLDANGAFIVTTKQGSADKMNISYSGTVGISNNATQQEWLDGPGYAYWYNKARVMDGDSEIFTREMVQKMIDGVDGWGNTNWYDKVYGSGVRQHHNISASGGSDKVNFFASIGYLRESGNIDHFDYHRYNLRSNMEAKITKGLTMVLGIAGRVERRNAPRYSANPNDWHNIPQQVIRALPYVPDTMDYGGNTYAVSTPTASSAVTPIGSINESGYSKSNRSYVQSNFTLKYDLPFVPGLSVRFQGAYDLTYNFNKALSKPVQTMIMQLPNAATTTLNYYLGNDASGNNITLSEYASRAYDLTTQSSISYSNTFGKNSINVLLLAETSENRSHLISASGSGLDFIELDELNNITNLTGNGNEKNPSIGGYSGHTRVAGFVGRLNYSYDDKYYVEASLRYDGSYLYGGMNDRWVALPGASLGWRMSNEKWFDVNWINNLKIRGGIGKTATTSGLSAFQWQNTMRSVTNSVVLGGVSQSMIYAYVLGNPFLSWAPCINYNVGFDITMWNQLLGLEFDVFYKYEKDKLAGVSG